MAHNLLNIYRDGVNNVFKRNFEHFPLFLSFFSIYGRTQMRKIHVSAKRNIVEIDFATSSGHNRSQSILLANR